MTAVRPDDTAGTGERAAMLGKWARSVPRVTVDLPDGSESDERTALAALALAVSDDVLALVAAVREAETQRDSSDLARCKAERELEELSASWTDALIEKDEQRKMRRDAERALKEAVARAERAEQSLRTVVKEDGVVVTRQRTERDEAMARAERAERLADDRLALMKSEEAGWQIECEEINRERVALAARLKAAVSGEAPNDE